MFTNPHESQVELELHYTAEEMNIQSVNSKFLTLHIKKLYDLEIRKKEHLRNIR